MFLPPPLSFGGGTGGLLRMLVVPVLDIGGEGALLIVEMVAGVSAGFSYDDYDADPVQ